MIGKLSWRVIPIVLVAACRDASTSLPPLRFLTISGGNNQVAFDTVSHLGSPLAVRVSSDSREIAGVRVRWSIVAGAGELTSSPTGSPLTDNETTTGPDGSTAVFFRPRSLGTNTVEASVDYRTGAVQFHAVMDPVLIPPQVLIAAGPEFDCTGGNDPTRFKTAATGDTTLSAAVGQRVGLLYAPYLLPVCAAQFKSTAVPPGGTPFDSGIIYAGDTFVFKPDVVGIWTFVDAINGGTAKLTVVP
jgi:hypothetical protein